MEKFVIGIGFWDLQITKISKIGVSNGFTVFVTLLAVSEPLQFQEILQWQDLPFQEIQEFHLLSEDSPVNLLESEESELSEEPDGTQLIKAEQMPEIIIEAEITEAEITKVEITEAETTKAKITAEITKMVTATKAETTKAEISNFQICTVKALIYKTEISDLSTFWAEDSQWPKLETSNAEITKAETTKAEIIKAETTKEEITAKPECKPEELYQTKEQFLYQLPIL